MKHANLKKEGKKVDFFRYSQMFYAAAIVIKYLYLGNDDYDFF